MLFAIMVGGLMAGPEIGRSQVVPQIGYVFPPAANPGTTVEVTLAGYDWTPDLEFITHHPGLQIEILGPPGPILLPPPPHWFGHRGHSGAWPLPREIAAKMTLAANVPPGAIEWQIANANGGSGIGRFIVSLDREVIEDEQADEPQVLDALPVTVSGRLFKNEEVDRYQWTAAEDGLMTVRLIRNVARSFHGLLAIHELETGDLVADAVSRHSGDAVLTFRAEGGTDYIASVHDVDFTGNRSMLYRLKIAHGTQVFAAVPAAGTRGITQSIEFVGIGVATGAARLETETREVAFPAAAELQVLDYQIETEFGQGESFRLLVTDLPESVESVREDQASVAITPPCGVTGVLEEQETIDRFEFSAVKDQQWHIEVDARKIGTRVDPILTVLGPDGEPIAENDDANGSPDSALDLTIPVDGQYTVEIKDLSGQAGTAAAVYRLSVTPPRKDEVLPDFLVNAPRNFNVLIGEKGELVISVVRRGGHKEPITIDLSGLPAGVTPEGDLVIAPDQTEIKIPILVAADVASMARVITVTGHDGAENTDAIRTAAPVLLCTTMKARCKVEPLVPDGGMIVHAGTTYFADVVVERMEGFEGEVRLEMASQQGRQRQGIWGPEIVVPVGVRHAQYPVSLPQWLESTRTSRMVCNAVAVVPDPQNNLRHLVKVMAGRITMSLEGALLVVSPGVDQVECQPGKPFTIPVSVLRSAKLPKNISLEFQPPVALAEILSADPVEVISLREKVNLLVETVEHPQLTGEFESIIRATVLQEGNRPVVSEATISVIVGVSSTGDN